MDLPDIRIRRFSRRLAAMIHYTVLVPQSSAGEGFADRLPELCGVFDGLNLPYEIVALDDSTVESSSQRWQPLLRENPCLRLIRLGGARGLSAALTAGLLAARGELVIAFEASGRYDLNDLPRLLARLTRADAVFGCRRASGARKLLRHLTLLPRRLLLGREVGDPDCLVWAARREAVEGLHLAKGMHRFLATLVAVRGYRVAELYLEPLQRPLGWSRHEAWPNPGDLLAAWWLKRRQKPLTSTEVFVREEDSAAKLVRIDPPQSLDRRNAPPSDAPRGDRKSRE